MKLCLISLYVILIYVIYKIFNTIKPFRKSIIEGNTQISGETNRNKHYAPDLNRPHIVENENECANSSVLLRYGNKKLCIPNNGIYHTNKSGCNGMNLTLENSVSGCPNSFKIPSNKMLAFTGNSEKCHIIQNPMQWNERVDTTLKSEKYLGNKNSNCSSFRITDNDPNKTSENDKWKYKSCVTLKMHDNDKTLSLKNECKNPDENYSWMYKFWPYHEVKAGYISRGNGQDRNTPNNCNKKCNEDKSCSHWHYYNGPYYKGCYLFSGSPPVQKTKMNNRKYSGNKEIIVGKNYHSGLNVKSQKQGRGFFYKWSDVKNSVLWSGNKTKNECKKACKKNSLCTDWQSCKKGSGCAGCYLFSQLTGPYISKAKATPNITGNNNNWAEFVRVVKQSNMAKSKNVNKKPMWSRCSRDRECKTNHCQNFYAGGPRYCMLGSDDECGGTGCYGGCWQSTTGKNCRGGGLKNGWRCRYDSQCRSDNCGGNGWGIRNGNCD
tara:strand:+ start:325 stop:1800 length:1476 start_codon:yes stop_codon:yes gene_type:complete